MSIQYRDDSFSENMPVDEIFEKFKSQLIAGEPVKALHVGSIEELEEVKNAVDKLKSSLINLPNRDEIQKFGVSK